MKLSSTVKHGVDGSTFVDVHRIYIAWIIGLSTLPLQEIMEYTLIEAVGGTVLMSNLNVIRETRRRLVNGMIPSSPNLIRWSTDDINDHSDDVSWAWASTKSSKSYLVACW